MTAGKQRLDLRGEAECPAVVCGVERLDAVRVAREEEAAPCFVPDCECEHAAQPMHHLGAMTRVEVQEHLRIGGRAEARAVGLELDAQLRIVVDLAVEHDDEPAVFTDHRLRSALGEIDDRRAADARGRNAGHCPPCT